MYPTDDRPHGQGSKEDDYEHCYRRHTNKIFPFENQSHYLQEQKECGLRYDYSLYPIHLSK
jgi:hypothetical protein